MTYVLETRQLTKVYGRRAAIQNVNLHVEEGRIYGLIGRNGAGKTTIMRIISGLSNATSGEYSLFGKSGSEKGRMLREVGVLIEAPGIYPRFSAYENLKIKCMARGIKPAGYVEDLLKTVGLGDTDMKKGAGAYSLGMRQRLGIALAMVGDPKILILDEPINGLDPQGIVDVRETLVRLRDEKGITIMISSHILDELSKVADAYGIINDGTLLDEFSAEELQKRSGQFVSVCTNDPAAALKALAAAGFRNVDVGQAGRLMVRERLEDTADMARAVIGAGLDLTELSLNTMSLEDYYIGVTGGKQDA
ncbi:MAG: ATP-binding cassette domain-containing protein [Clostridia bacterium]|nr:ATP-binding cassette domain-containing protein [Clostridia bacterium]